MEGDPLHPFTMGVTVMVAVFDSVVLFSVLNAGTFPLPLAGSPIEVLELVQVKVVPGMLLLKLEADTGLLAHTVKFPGVTTVGVGLMVIVYEDDGPIQLFNVAVTVTVAVIGVVVLLIAVKPGTLVLPLAANPIMGFELVQLIVAPGGVLLKIVSDAVVPLQKVRSSGTATVGN